MLSAAGLYTFSLAYTASSSVTRSIAIFGVDGHTFKNVFQTDIVIILRLVPGKKPQLISLPRALYFNPESCDLPTKQKPVLLNMFSYEENGRIPFHKFRDMPPKERKVKMLLDCLSLATNENIDRYIFLSASDFVKAVNTVSPVTINLEKPIDETQYLIENESNDCIVKGSDEPLAGCPLTQIYFDAGIHHLNGSQMLSIIRSRKSAESPGASAREKRALTVIEGILASLQQHPLRVPFFTIKLLRGVTSNLELRDWLELLKLYGSDSDYIALGDTLARKRGGYEAGLVIADKMFTKSFQEAIDPVVR